MARPQKMGRANAFSTQNMKDIHDPPDYIKPSLQDILLTDITPEVIVKIAKKLKVEYLSRADSVPASFPVEGLIHGNNKRLMVNLVCQRFGNHNAPAVNVIFLIDTGSPYSFLSPEAMEALVGQSGSNIPDQMDVLIHSTKTTACEVSPQDKHFADVNVLGMDFLYKNGLGLKLNVDIDRFSLFQ